MAKNGKDLAQLKEEGKLLKAKINEKNVGSDGTKDSQKNSEVTELQSQLKDIESCIKSVKKRNYEQVAELKKVAIIFKRELGDNVDQDAVLYFIQRVVIRSKEWMERSQ